jgi:hypothetical protein
MPAHLILFDFIILIIWINVYKKAELDRRLGGP